jgi:adenylate cyclase
MSEDTLSPPKTAAGARHVALPAAASSSLAHRVARLKQCPLFADIPGENLQSIAGLATEQQFPVGTMIMHQDEPADAMFILCNGQVQVFGTGSDNDEAELTVIKPGETLGESGYFCGRKRTASARAIEPIELLRISYDHLPRCFELAPGLAFGLLHVMATRIRDINYLYQTAAHRHRAAERSLRHLSEYLDGTSHLDLRLDSSNDPSHAKEAAGVEVLIQRVVGTASKLMNADRGSLFLLDSANGELWSKVAEGAGVKEIRVKGGTGIVGWVAAHGQPLNIPDAYADQRFNPETDRRTGYKTRAVLCGPVRNLQGQTIGVIQVINKINDGFFSSSDEILFRAFAHQAAIAVENFRLFRELKVNSERMELMLDVATSVSTTLDLPSLIKGIVAKVKAILNCDRASFFVLDRESNELWSMEATGTGLKEIRFPASAGLAGHTARSNAVLNITDAYEDQRFNRSFDQATGYRTRSVLCVPVCDRDGNVAGVTQAINKLPAARPGTAPTAISSVGEIALPFTDEDIAFLRAISSQIGVAVENARLYARTLAMKAYLESVQQSITNSIVTLDNTYHVVTANKAALALLAAEEHVAVGKDLREVLGSPNPNLLALVDKVYTGADNAAGYDLDLDLPAHTSKRGIVNATVLPLTAADGARQGVVAVLEDVTREKQVMSTFTRYVAKSVAEQLLNNPDLVKLGGRKGKATVLFSDIREFTTISEGLAAEAVVDMLNEYFTLMVQEVLREEGTVDKFIGDALMALFGVPLQRDDDAKRAVRAALRMVQALGTFNTNRARRGFKAIRIGIGINTGQVVSGNIGSEKQMDYTVIGDDVNTASRLEGLNKYYGTQILISDSTRQEIGDNFSLRLVDRVLVVGRTHPTPVYEVLGVQGVSLTTAQQNFAEGFELYLSRQFETAMDAFKLGAQNDPLCRVFLSRCIHFLQNPPPDEWDGVWKATGK